MPRLTRALVPWLFIVFAVVLAGALGPLPVAAAPKTVIAGRCRPQAPQPFLQRDHYVLQGSLSPGAHEKALRYRTEHYGYVEGFGSRAWNAHEPKDFAQTTTFAGLRLLVHKKIVDPLHCVEREIQRACRAAPYQPKAMGGFRDHNTYRGGEVTNHLYGIAIDIDPDRNPCCHCVKPWSDEPRCARQVHSPYERAALPPCWIHSFERFGFYWLGHDELEDTMHFEFLGIPRD